MKEELLNYLKNQTAFLNLEDLSELFTASKLAEIFSVKRNTVSQYLNQLTESGELVKINSRPVYYFHKGAFEKQFFSLRANYYESVQTILSEQPMFGKEQDFFSLLIGHDKSLNRVIEQIKAALNYPDGGLPVLINGESGTGKSYLVKLIHHYCIQNELLPEDAPFITLNCAQYANNPELLTSNLFGSVKGAYTGAESDRKGAFEAADGGILFLDEVHRLNAEGQEKLFTYLDQGEIYRMGDTAHPITVSTRLFFATTEELTSNFLNTFIRRIPIQVTIPSLQQRARNERLELIYSFLINEQVKIKRQLMITGQTLELLASGSFKGNIGELKNIIKVMAAQALSEANDQQQIKLTIYHLPESLLSASSQNLQTSLPEEVVITSESRLDNLMLANTQSQKRVEDSFTKVILEYQKSQGELTDCHLKLKEIVDQLFDYLLFETDRQQKHEMLLYLTQYVRETFRQMESAYQVKFNGNSVYAVGYYLFQRGSNRWLSEDIQIMELIRQLERQISEAYPASYHYVERILELCRPKIDIEVSAMDRIVLTLYLKKADWTKEQGMAKAVIVAHGYATASSIANVANRFLENDIFESFDMPLDVTPQQIAEEILDYSENNDISNGLVILVDMGSLKEIYQYFPKQINVPIVIMNNVTTPLAIAIGENIKHQRTLNELASKSAAEAVFDWEIIYPEENRTKALLTTCQTGIGTATQICHLLEKSLPSTCELKILPYEYRVLEEKKSEETVFSVYDVLGIIGTDDPLIPEMPYLSLEELISGDEQKVLTEWLAPVMTAEENQIFNRNVIRNFSLEKVIDSVTILDTDKVMSEIDLFMRDLELAGRIQLSNAKKLALYVHVSCLIERLIRNVPIETYEGYHDLYQCQKDMLEIIKQAFSVIEKDYSVTIPDSEIAYIFDIVYKNADTTMKDEEF
ncbi:sigma 54-interacting transcriptional regulator [Candidatus Enterococcus murrayae]|uniref:Sigma 54-interacting transcriptional regulator n=1 Tax=Candidatus Enterococcus murrayae TaxID=2815321 RepID=A0ABS3HG18_9ENTE|nr:sigma-54-dependent transcriptional regulator [Enterococcus sp. MJM16]MBO0452396.1 sigma 54-interacting transcriptional regulator [Enterococcus sp. MJM16]